MPRWPIIALGAIAYWAAPWVVATLLVLSWCVIWFGIHNTWKHTLPLALVFAVLSYVAFGRAEAASLRCTGMCYGSISQKNYLPRSKYVHPYVTKRGRYVRQYTRSK